MSRLDRAVRRLPFADEDRGKALAGLALAVLTVLATMVAALQTDAGIRAQRGKRDADRIALEAAGRDGGGLVRIGTGYGVWRRWYEQVERSRAARAAAEADPDRDDAPMLEALAGIDSEIAEWMRQHSELLRAPYYDEDVSGTSFLRYEVDVQIEPRLRAQELHAVEASVAAAWDTRSSTYVTILTIIAVALFFVGLGSQLRPPARRFLVASGAILGLVSFGWAASEALSVIRRVPDDAIVRVAQARREWLLAYEPTSGSLTAEQEAGLRRAVALADEALAIDPSFLSAHRARAEGQLAHGEALRLANGPGPDSDELLRAAVADYQLAVRAHADDFATWANLGWAAFLSGDGGLASSATQRAVEIAPEDPTLYVQRATIRAFTGEVDAARADVETALRVAADVASDSGSYQLSLATYFMRRLAEQDAPRAAILAEMEQRIREAQVAIVVLDRPSPDQAAPSLEVVGITALRIAPDGSLAEGLPVEAGEESIDPDAVGYRVRVTASEGADGRTLSARLGRAETPDPAYDVDRAWPDGETSMTVDLLSPYGRAGYWVDAGAYDLRLYLDAASRASLTWRVPTERGPALEASVTEVLGQLEAAGMECQPGATGSDPTTCRAETESRGFTAEATQDPDGGLVRLSFEARSLDGESVEDDARRYFEPLLLELYGEQRGSELVEWMGERHERFGQVRMLGTWVRTFGEAETSRSLEILP